MLLLSGMETLGLDEELGAKEFCSILAWNLEESVNEKYHTSKCVVSTTNEYRDKIRSLRFNLQDPKNPMLCARVLAGNMPVKELINANTDDLASHELKLKRQQLEEESMKNVVLSLDIAKQKLPATGINCELAERIRVDEATTVTKKFFPSNPQEKSSTQESCGVDAPLSIPLLASSHDESLTKSPSTTARLTQISSERRKFQQESMKSVVLSLDIAKQKPPATGIKQICSSKPQEKSSTQCCGVAAPSTTPLLPPSLGESLTKSPSTTTRYTQDAPKERNRILASLPPPPLQRMTSKPFCANPFVSEFAPPDNEHPSHLPPDLVSITRNHPFAVASPPRAHHISSQSGTDLFHITISKLKTSFTTKIATDQSCKYQVDRFLPSILIEKGRLSLDQFNTFIYEKTKSGKWTVAHLKLSSIEGNTNMSCYKKFYKEYESIGKLTMIQVSETTKIFLITPKFLRVCSCLSNVKNLSRSCTYVVVLTKDQLPKKQL